MPHPVNRSAPAKLGVHFQTAGLVRLSQILGPSGPIPIGRSSWWAGVKSGRFPKPIKLGPRTTAWRVEDINALIANPEKWQA